MLNLGLLPSLSQIDHELMVAISHKKTPPWGGAISVAYLCFSQDF
jgi:hypothetical protein